MKKIAAIMTATTLVAGSVFAGVVNYSTSFTTSDGFADGTINGQNSWTAFNNAHYIIDADGVGTVDSTNAGGPVHGGTQADVTSELALNKTITMTLSAQFNGPLVNQNSARWILGLGDAANTSLTPLVGGGMFQQNAATTFYTADQVLSNPSKVNTGVTVDTAFHTLTTTITRNAGTSGLFDVGVSFDGGPVSALTVSNADLWNGSTSAIAGFRFQGNTAGSVDSFSVSTIPEPATLGMVAVFGGALLFIRRRFMI